MSVYVPWIVYNNLIKLHEYRCATVTSKLLKLEDVSRQLNDIEYIIINSEREIKLANGSNQAKTAVILIAPGSKYQSKSADLMKLLTTANSQGITECMFVTENGLTTQIKRQLLTFIEKNPQVYIDDFKYEKFQTEMPKKVGIPRHEVATWKEVTDFCEKYKTAPEYFPTIMSDDTQAIWIGLRPGQVCKVYRLSETSGIAIIYRTCARARF